MNWISKIFGKESMDYRGMTVNERLHHSGLGRKYDKAEERQDIEEMKIILRKIEIDESSISAILKKIK